MKEHRQIAHFSRRTRSKFAVKIVRLGFLCVCRGATLFFLFRFVGARLCVCVGVDRCKLYVEVGAQGAVFFYAFVRPVLWLEKRN